MVTIEEHSSFCRAAYLGDAQKGFAWQGWPTPGIGNPATRARAWHVRPFYAAQDGGGSGTFPPLRLYLTCGMSCVRSPDYRCNLLLKSLLLCCSRPQRVSVATVHHYCSFAKRCHARGSGRWDMVVLPLALSPRQAQSQRGPVHQTSKSKARVHPGQTCL